MFAVDFWDVERPRITEDGPNICGIKNPFLPLWRLAIFCANFKQKKFNVDLTKHKKEMKSFCMKIENRLKRLMSLYCFVCYFYRIIPEKKDWLPFGA